jgi:predicted enzyme related to lactoylglutathione lyase
MKLRHVRIVTDDVAVLARFYQVVTGITPAGSGDYLEFDTPEGMLAISSQKTMRERGASATVPARNRSVVLDFEVDDVDKERARLADIVKHFVMEPVNQPWGNRSMLFRDPDGNLINFFTPQSRAGSDQENLERTGRSSKEKK